MIHIRIFQRNGRKRITTVDGIPNVYDLPKIVKKMRKVLHCSVSLTEDKNSKKKIIRASGDQRENIRIWLVNASNINCNNIVIHGG
jgi:translation initiation factor 1